MPEHFACKITKNKHVIKEIKHEFSLNKDGPTDFKKYLNALNEIQTQVNSALTAMVNEENSVAESESSESDDEEEDEARIKSNKRVAINKVNFCKKKVKSK